MDIISFLLFSMPMVFAGIAVIFLGVYLYNKIIKKRTANKYLILFAISVAIVILSSIYLYTVMMK